MSRMSRDDIAFGMASNGFIKFFCKHERPDLFVELGEKQRMFTITEPTICMECVKKVAGMFNELLFETRED